jgi:spore coat protein A, manganese oxidase
MTFTRVSILGSTGLALFQLLACSSSLEKTQTNDSSARDERIEQTDENDASSELSTDEPKPTEECDYRPGEPLDPQKLKWKNTLTRPRVFAPTTPGGSEYVVTARATKVQMLPDCYPKTKVFAYGGRTVAPGETEPTESFSSPGPTFEMSRGAPAHVTWINDIDSEHLFPIDPTLHWANPKGYEDPPKGPFAEPPPIDPKWQKPVPIVTHVHGLEVLSASDGGPEAWFTRDWAEKGKDFVEKTSHYPNSQPGATLWYHDHTLGITRLNVYAGLAGMYIIRDDNADIDAKLPNREHEMPLVIQDKSFDSEGALSYPTEAGDHHPYWTSSFWGDTFVVNGKVWPKMVVERARYRFRVLNGANARSFNLALSNSLPFTVIGSDGGYLAAPAEAQTLKLAPGERADVVVDFSSVAPGESIILSSDGEDVVKFEVPSTTAKPADTSCLLTPASTPADTDPPLCFPSGLNNNELESTPDLKRTVTLLGAPGHGMLLNGQMFAAPATEVPQVGTTEDWDIVNTMGMEHPIHLHLVQFKLLERRALTDEYLPQWHIDNGTDLPLAQPPKNPEVDKYLGASLPIDTIEKGWKDTVLVPGNSVARIRVRFTPQDSKTFPFDPTEGPGYVWHCHVLEHEDNEMMRPLLLKK